MGEIEQTMGGSELLEWFAILDEMPWGSFREDAVAETMLAHMILGPNCADPAKAMEKAKLPWTKKRAPAVRIVSGRELAASLMAWGWKEVGTDA